MLSERVSVSYSERACCRKALLNERVSVSYFEFLLHEGRLRQMSEYELLIDFLLQRVFVLRIGVSTSYPLTAMVLAQRAK